MAPLGAVTGKRMRAIRPASWGFSQSYRLRRALLSGPHGLWTLNETDTDDRGKQRCYSKSLKDRPSRWGYPEMKLSSGFLVNTLVNATLRDLQITDLDEAVRVVSYSMRDNPVNVRAFCREGTEQPPRSLMRFFRPVLRGLYKRGVITGAFRDNALVGVCGMARPGSCQPTLLEKLEVLPSLVFGNPRGTTVRVLRWTGEWARRDP